MRFCFYFPQFPLWNVFGFVNGACYKIWRVFFALKNVVKVVHSLVIFSLSLALTMALILLARLSGILISCDVGVQI